MKRTAIITTVLCVTVLAACGDSGGSGDSESDGESTTVTLVTHDSFAASKDVLRQFTHETGYTVEVLKGGDAGSAVNQAVLSKDNPQGDVFFGIDNTLLSRGLDHDLFAPYRARGLDRVPAELRLDRAEHRVTPVDYGDICVNYDRGYFADRRLDPPRTFADLAEPAYRDLLVTENAATSSPGLGFLLGTIGAFGDGWQDYWSKLEANGVEVVDGWEQAYYERFSGAGKGDRPLVVSYASSPPAGVLGMDPKPTQAPTGVATGTCFRQIEFAGLLNGAANEAGGKALIDFMLGETFQADLPLRMFVNPAVRGTRLPEVFTRYGETIDEPETLTPRRIAESREERVKQWASLVLE